MAETKNSPPAKFDKDALKEWFTLAEVAERWTRLSGRVITEDDLLHYGETENIEICFNFSRVVVQWGFWKDSGGENQAQYYFVPLTNNEAWTGLLKLDDQGIRMAKVGQGTPEVLYWPHGRVFTGRLLDFVMGGDSSITGDDAIVGNFYRGAVDKDGTEQINMAGLAVTRSERDRFEQEHGINQPGVTAKMPEPDSEETENQRLKRTLAALVLGLSKQSAKYKTGEKPNTSAIVQLALDGVTPESGAAPFRYGKSTFTNAINSALLFSNGELDQ